MDAHTPEHAIIHEYYACFNERRLGDAAGVLSRHALLELLPFGQQEFGVEGYSRFASTWIAAFPDAAFAVEHIEPQSDSLFDVHLRATGTHQGVFDIGAFRFRPTRAKARLRLRELLHVTGGRIASATLSVDVTELVSQLSAVDYEELVASLGRIRRLSDELSAQTDDTARREIANRLGQELDAARRAIRPHYYRS
jgi:predicted ester cyclase